MKFKAVYVDGIKEPTTIHTVYGRAMHKLMEKMYKEQKFDLSEWLTRWPAILDKELAKNNDLTISSDDKSELLSKGYKHTSAIHSWLGKEELLHPSLESEMWFSCQYKDHTFNGLIDFATDKEAYHLLGDYKFGKTISTDHKHQLMLYMAFYRKLTGKKEVKGVLIYPHQIEKSHYIEPTAILREESSKFFTDIYDRLIVDKEFKPTKNKFCNNCFLKKQQRCPLFKNTYVSMD